MRKILLLAFVFACLFTFAGIGWVYADDSLDKILSIDGFVNSSGFEKAIEILDKARSGEFVVSPDELSAFEGNICPVLGKARKLLGQWNSVLKKLREIILLLMLTLLFLKVRGMSLFVIKFL